MELDFRNAALLPKELLAPNAPCRAITYPVFVVID
jgi:hypothetical protein